VHILVLEQATYLHACQIASSNSVKQHKLRKRIAWLSEKEGKAKEFVSLYIPLEASIDRVIATLKNELADEEKNSQKLRGILKQVIRYLKEKKEIPENGCAIFAGVFSSNEQESELLNVEEVIPPEPITKYLYEVNDHFELQPLRDILRNQKIVGIIALTSKEASFGLQYDEHLQYLESMTSGISGKTEKGGQSQRRYERERDMAIAYFFRRIAEHATKAFLENSRITVLLVGGPGQTKNDFLKSDYLHYELSNMVLNVVDTQYAGKEAIKEISDKSSEALKNMCGPEEKKIVQRLMAELNKQTGLATYGLDRVLDSLRNGEASVAIVNDDTSIVEVVALCKKCGLSKSQLALGTKAQVAREMASSPCLKCKSTEYEVVEKDIVDVLEDLASRTDAVVEVISSPSAEKAQLAALGGIAALLRYKHAGN
jgi:peptide chain release factor subunit 1